MGNLTEKQIDKICDLVQVFLDQDVKYAKINKLLEEAHGCADFSPRIEPVSNSVHSAVISLLDELVGGEDISYFLYECQNMKGGGFVKTEGRKWKLKTVNDLKKYLNRFTNSNNSAKLE